MFWRPLVSVLFATLVACGDDAAPDPATPDVPAVVLDDDGLPVLAGAHLLLITVDALRPDHLGAFGYERDISSTMDSFAAESTVFEHAYAQAPHSSYSLCSLMTGEYLHELVRLERPLPDATLASTLGDAGFRTHAIFTTGIFYTDGEDLAQYDDGDMGFAEIDDTSDPADDITDEALDVVEDVEDDDEPRTFLWVHYFDPHEPYRDESLGTSAVDRYDGEIRNVDRAIERLLQGVRERWQRPVVVVLSADHGEEFRDHGGVSHGSKLYQEQIRVPLMIRIAGREPARVATPVELVDVAPTLLGLVGVEAPPSMRGDDLRPFLVGRTPDVGPVHAAVARKRAVIDWPWKLLLDQGTGRYELYDLESDPVERRDRSREPDAPITRLVGLIGDWHDRLRAAPGSEPDADPARLALDRGRLSDQRSVMPLLELLASGAPAEQRREAVRLVAEFRDRTARDVLAAALADPDEIVAAEAAVALAEMRDRRSRAALERLVARDEVDPDLRARAALGLGRLQSRAAVEGLIEVLEGDRSPQDRRLAAHWLGMIGDARAYDALLEATEESHIRYKAITGLGLLGDVRAYDSLVDMLEDGPRTMIKDSIARSFGWLRDRRALPHLVRLSQTEPELIYASESLVRLDAIGQGVVGGADVGPGTAGMQRCHRLNPRDVNYRNLTWCETSDSRASVALRIPDAVRNASNTAVLVRARRMDAGEVTVTVRSAGTEIGTVTVTEAWHEHRLASAPGRLRSPLELVADDETARLGLDHVLLIPAPD